MIHCEDLVRTVDNPSVSTTVAVGVLVAARAYVAHGMSVIPCRRVGTEKRPLVAWSEYTRRLPSEEELNGWFADSAMSIGVVCGSVSGNLEVIDFDCRGEDFDRWIVEVERECPTLVGRLVFQRTPSGGVHVLYRTEEPVPGSVKLARKMLVSDEPFVEAYGKRVATTVGSDGTRFGRITSIETRGEGGMALCHPSAEYRVVQGDIAHLPRLTAAERSVLISAAKRFDEVTDASAGSASSAERRGSTAERVRPGDDFNRRGDLRAVLRKAGWILLGTHKDGNDHWQRPGKSDEESDGLSATFNGEHFYVFSSNAPPFEPDQAYTPFAVLAWLEHGGDFEAAARALALRGFGDGSRASDGERSPPSVTRHVQVVSAAELARSRPTMRPVIVNGLLRSGEVMNLVAPPKIGKSWLALWLAMAVASGREWLPGFEAVTHRVLLADNELHIETLADRVRALASAKGVDLDRIAGMLQMACLRGEPCDLDPLAAIEAVTRSVRPGLLAIDALYRALPVGTEENDNSAVTRVYGRLVRLAAETGAAVVVVHHTSKGDQRFRAVTDVGAGAGAQSRACDSHVILRPGNRAGSAVMDMALRSFESRVGVGLRFDCPLWSADPTVRPRQPAEDRATEVGESWTAERFAQEIVGSSPRTRADIESGRPAGMSKREAGRLLADAVARGCVARSHPKRCVPATFTSTLSLG
jgi:hypothetical protein